jgi:transcription elongation factor GreA
MTEEMLAMNIVRVGTKVKLYDVKWDEEIEYEIIPSAEFNSSSLDTISIDSPVGKALLGKTVDDLVEIEVPAGKIEYKVLEIN